MTHLIWLLPVVFLFSLAMTWSVRWYALRRNLLDIPNQRSSHTAPTPRGGGVAIVLGLLLALPVLFSMGLIASSAFWSLSGAGLLVALIGFCDDHAHIAARWRLLAHFIAAIWAVVCLGGVPPLTVAGAVVEWGFLGSLIAVVYLVWMLNLYNFMDGIDGIAGLEAITVCLSGALLYALQGYRAEAILPMALAVAAAGFLIWNLPPARIFMGDAGSGFLGITLGLLSLQAAWVSPSLFWAWFILLGVFISDATVTLLRRMLRGERVYEAHCSHAYQHVSRKMGRHLPVTLCVAAINVFWLLPIAWWVASGGSDIAGVVLAYLPLLTFSAFLGAGQPE